jgi:hypothetical protein
VAEEHGLPSGMSFSHFPGNYYLLVIVICCMPKKPEFMPVNIPMSTYEKLFVKLMKSGNGTVDNDQINKAVDQLIMMGIDKI